MTPERLDVIDSIVGGVAVAVVLLAAAVSFALLVGGLL